MDDPTPLCGALKDLATVDDTREYFGVRRCRAAAPARLAGPGDGPQQNRDAHCHAPAPSPARCPIHLLTALKLWVEWNASDVANLQRRPKTDDVAAVKACNSRLISVWYRGTGE